MLEKKIARIALVISFTLIFFMWLIHAANLWLELDLYKFGIYPLEPKNLIGIIAAPFIHSTEDFGHILNNSVPAFVLTWLLFYHYRTIATQVIILLFVLTGLSMWLLARESYHIGMSGIIYGLTSFLVISGFFRKNMRVAAVSLFVIFLYGSLVWGIFPTSARISWEGHALGFFSGIILAVVYKNKGPQPQKMHYEIEEELGIESEDEYWKIEEEKSEEPTQKSVQINYEYKEKQQNKLL